MDKKRHELTKQLLRITETTGLSAQAAIHALALEKAGERHRDEEDQLHSRVANSATKSHDLTLEDQ
jgi:hypothetical protein